MLRRYLLATNSYVCESNGDNLNREMAIARDLTSPPFSLPVAALVAQSPDADGPLALWNLALFTRPRRLTGGSVRAGAVSVCSQCRCVASLGGGVIPVPRGGIACSDAEIRRCHPTVG